MKALVQEGPTFKQISEIFFGRLKAREFCVCILVMKYLLFASVTEVTLLLTTLISSFFKETWVWGKYIKSAELGEAMSLLGYSKE